MVARWLVVVTVWTMLAGGIAGRASTQASAELDRCERFLHEAISGHRASDTLAALRELRDPALRGVFVAAATSSDPMPRAHSVLWLAELAEPPAIDVGLVLAMPTPREQATVLLHAAEHGLLSDEATAALLLADSLGPRIKVALLAQRIARGVGVDIERIDALTVHELPDVRFGALLLAMAADPVGPSLDRLDAELGKLDAQRRHGVCNYLLDFASTHRLGSIEPFLELMLIEFAGDPARHARVIESLLEQRTGIAESEWLDAYDLAFSTAERVPLAIAALHTARGIGLAPFERLLASESELLVAIGAAGRSVAIGEPSIDTFQGLIKTGLAGALTWAIEHAEMLGDEAASLIAASVVFWAQASFWAPGPAAESVRVLVPQGASVRSIAADFEAAGAISNATLFVAAARVTGVAASLKAGEYEVPARASMADVLNLVSEGRAVQHRVSVIEGRTVKEVIALLEAKEILTGEISEIPAEGMLAPDTYFIARGERRQAVIDRMVAAQERRLARLWAKRQPGLPLASPEEALILASIIEKETGMAEERRVVASVFINRLRDGMRLQSDPTVVYGVNDGAGPLGRAITRSDLNTPTPFNTYTIPGLPPTPIANPGEAAIEAALNPEETEYFYFVADGTGGHAFARTYPEHQRNVAVWRKIERERKAE